MPSEYDLLLEQPQTSEYDALLSIPEPQTEYDSLLAYVPAEIAQADEQAEIERTAGQKAPQWAKSAAEAVPGVIKQALKLPAKVMLAAGNAQQGRLHWPTDKEVETPLVSPEVAQMVMKAPFVASGINQATDGPAGAVRGVLEATGDAASSFTTPENIGQLALTPAGKVTQRLIAGVFEGQAIAGLPEQWEALKNAKTLSEQVRIGGGMVLGTGLPAVGFLATLKGTKPKTVEVPKVDDVPLAQSDNPAMARIQPELLPEAATSEATRPLSVSETLAVEEPALAAVAPDQSKTQTPTAQTEITTPVLEKASPEPTSTKNAITNAEREARGIAEAEQAASRDFGTVWDEAAEIAQNSADAPADLVRSIVDNPRALTDTENALLLRRQIDMQSKHDAAVNAVNEAPDAVARTEAQANLDRVRDDLQVVYDAVKVAGTETSRGLNARKMLANEDYSLTKMLATTRAVANRGKPLEKHQVKQVEELHARISAAETKLAAYEARDQFNAALKEAKKEAKQAGFKPLDFLDQQARNARERIAARRSKLYADPVGVTQVAHLADEAIIGAHYVAKGVTKFADWSAQMIAEFGLRIKPHLQALFARAQQMHSETARTGRTVTAEAINRARATNLQNQINALEAQIQAGEKIPKPKGVKVPYDLKSAQLKAQRDKLKTELKAIDRQNNPPPTKEETGLKGDKKRIQGRIQEIQKRTEAGDFTKAERKPPRMDAEKARLLYEYDKAREAYNRGLFEAKLRNQGPGKKILRTGGEVLNTARAIMTSFDLSAVLRQGGFITLAHPIRSLKSFPAMFQAFASERAQHRINAEIMSRPNAPLYARSKLYLADDSMTSLNKMEEAYMSRWAGKIPIIAGSQRAYTTFLNKLRADSFDAMAASLNKRGVLTPDEAKGIANFVNVATGRGNMGGHAQSAVFLNTVFFAPRLVLSRFQLMAGQPIMRGGSTRARTMIATEYDRFLAGAGVVYALGQAAGAEPIELDPQSPDFLKIKFGNSRIDPLAGLAQVTRVSLQEGQALKRFLTQSKEKVSPYMTGGAVGLRFMRTKLSPIAGGIYDAQEGKDVVGNKATPKSVALKLAIPMSFGDIYKVMQEQGVPKGTAMAVLALFGMSLQTYSAKKKN